MGRAVANRWLPIALLAALMIGACSASPASPPTGPSVAPSVATPTPTLAASSTPAPSATPASAPTAVPVPASWVEGPRQPAAGGVQFQDVVWTGTRFVAVGQADVGAVFLDSTDGADWHRQKSTGAHWNPTRIATGPAGVVAIGGISDHPASWFSSDGLTWIASRDALPLPSVGTDSLEITDVVASADGWLAVGRRDPACNLDCGTTPSRAYVWTSSDGLHWTRIPDQNALKGGGMAAVTRADQGFVAAGVASAHAAIWVSPDGLAWSRVPDARMFHSPASPDGSLPVDATGVAANDGVMVVVGQALGQDASEVRAWWSTDGLTWANAEIERAKGGQVFSVAATPFGFLAVGPSGADSCLGGIWSSIDGRAWRCEASAPGFEGFGPYAAAGSDTVQVVVGLTSAGVDEESPNGLPGASWSRQMR
jgi:hypothetical protein